MFSSGSDPPDLVDSGVIRMQSSSANPTSENKELEEAVKVRELCEKVLTEEINLGKLLKQQHRDAVKVNNETEKNTKELMEKQKQLLERKEQLERDTTKMSAFCAELKEKAKVMETEIKWLMKDITIVESFKERSEETLLKCGNEFTGLMGTLLGDEAKKGKELYEKYKAAIAQRKATKEYIKKLQMQAEEEEKKAAAYEKSLKEMEARRKLTLNEDMQKVITNLEAEKARLNKHKADLRASIVTMEHQLPSMKDKHRELEQQIAAEQKRHEDAIEELKNHIEGLSKASANLDKEHMAKSKALLYLQRLKEDKLATLKKEEKERTHQVNEKQKEVNVLKAKLDELTAILSNMKKEEEIAHKSIEEHLHLNLKEEAEEEEEEEEEPLYRCCITYCERSPNTVLSCGHLICSEDIDRMDRIGTQMTCPACKCGLIHGYMTLPTQRVRLPNGTHEDRRGRFLVKP